ncbi:MAG: response regulator [Flavobacterium sp. BFFFF2]|nr:MAG: response regulator [Flavobacterium sp. BFFFF2]
MQHSSLSFLLVDDHPFILEAYKNGIVSFCENSPVFYEAFDCRSGYELIQEVGNKIDIAFLDISMPHFFEKNIKSGLDLALLIREKFPRVKIVILSMHSENMHIEEIMDQIAPEGMIIKNDLNFPDLIYMLERIVADDTFLSETIVKMIQDERYRYMGINKMDKIILKLLSQGETVKNIASDLKLNTTILQKRLHSLAYIMEVPEQSDLALLAKYAQEKHII